MASESIRNQPVRLFPSTKPSEPASTPLSILDATCARFSDTGAIWLFEAQNGPSDDQLIKRLRTSFVKTLDQFPQWAGQLHWAPFRPGGSHTERFHRGMLTYGTNADPGVEWNVVKHDFSIQSIAPAQASTSRICPIDEFPQAKLLSKSKLALSNQVDYEGLACVLVQLNLFACGGYGIGLRFAHMIADAQSMLLFVHQWAAHSRSTVEPGSASLFGSPVFDPPQLDTRAAGNIDDPEVDAAVAETARSLPLNRFSWWDMDAPGYSPLLVESTKKTMPPSEYLDKVKLSPSTVAPWQTWDLSRPVSSAIVHFTAEEISRLRERAYQDVSSTAGISRTDALLAYTYQLITRARDYTVAAEDEAFLDVALDARRRVSPPLSEAFLGSPLFMTHVKEKAGIVRQEALGKLALRLRESLKRFTPDKVAALLHDAAHEVSPQRLWLGFVGTRHVLVTSWQRLRLYEVDFEGRGRRPAYVHPVMQKIDGVVVISEPVSAGDGVDVVLHLDAETMAKFREELEKDTLRV